MNKENLIHRANRNIIRVMVMAGKRLYFSKKSLVNGHNVHKCIWIPGKGEEFSVDKEPSNLHDNFAISMVTFTYILLQFGHAQAKINPLSI